MGFAVRAVPSRATGSGYADASDYEKLTRQQRAGATNFTHDFGVVAVTTQPKGTGGHSLQQPQADQTGRVRQVGSAGHAVPCETAGGNKAGAVARPFNRTALHTRSAERKEKANAENALATRRQGMRGTGLMSSLGGSWGRIHARDQRFFQVATSLEEAEDRQRNEDVQQCLLRGAVAWSMGLVGQKPSDAFNGSPAQQQLQANGNLDTADYNRCGRIREPRDRGTRLGVVARQLATLASRWRREVERLHRFRRYTFR